MAEKDSRYPLLLFGIAAVLLMLVVVSFLYIGGGFISSPNPIPTPNSTSPCLYGYVCGIKSDGCAVPGAIYNCPNEPANPPSNITSGNGTVAVNLTQELKNAATAGFTLNQSMFYANSSSECSKQLISSCDNNVPSQFVCVNQQYAGTVSSQWNSIYSAPTACPMFIMAGSVSCGLAGNYCVVFQEGLHSPLNAT